MTRSKEDRSPVEQKVWEFDWVISTMESDTGDFIVQSNTPYYGLREMKMVEGLGLSEVAISSYGANGQLRIHVREE